ncbi:pilus assembly protein [Spongorhabdus nitratireducens]
MKQDKKIYSGKLIISSDAGIPNGQWLAVYPVAIVLVLALLMLGRYGWATSANFASVPPLLSVGGTPKVMLVVGKDHQLFQKAYTDYSDITGDGVIDVGYDDTYEYAGYFDPIGCYQYTSGEFRPVQAGTGPNGHWCNIPPAAPNLWSGNFLNWAAMTRIDILRQVVYGGKRSTDTATRTVLERANLPPDIHSFVKVYDSTISGVGTGFYTPFTDNVISMCNLTESSGGAPRMRVARGGFRRWSMSEVIQCQWNNGSSSPSSSRELGTYTVRVEVCVNGIDSNRPRCRPYGSNTKPAGLLQRYGENGQIHFGLLSGSDHNNIRGGVVRRNVQRLVGNANSGEDEINLATGQFTSTLGIIKTIDAFRIRGYSYSSRRYNDCSTHSISISTFKTSTWSSRQCRDWGNPTGEQLLETYLYFAGGNRTGAFYTNSDSGLPAPNWTDPLTPATSCSRCIAIVLSAGLNSFDWDDLGSASGLPGLSGASAVNSKTNQVGNLEAGGSFAGTYLYGGTGGSRHCTAKGQSNLSGILGLCPEQPALEGSYSAAGLAFHAKTTDLRTQPGFDNKQTVTSYAIRLAESVPSFVIPVGSGEVIFVPTCESTPGSSWLPCSMFDVDVLSLSYSGGRPVAGELRFAWEDSPWGNDYDLDGMSQISFCVGSTCSPSIGSNQIRLQVQVPYSRAGNRLRFSYTISGTSSDGLASWLYRDRGNNDYLDGNSSGPQYIQDPTTYTAGSSSAELLRGPLWYVGKYGGFDDLDEDGTPNNVSGDSREWDSEINETGELGSDGIPDHYFELRNPSQLEAQLNKILGDVAAQRASGTDVALTSANKTGVGATYQANYEPRRQQNNRVVTWIGDVYAYFIDGLGHFREDGNGNKRLDSYGVDPIIRLQGETVQRYTTNNSGQTTTPSGSPVPLYQTGMLWSARDQLAGLTNSQVTNQRSFQNSAGTGRYVITWLDQDQNFQVNQNEVRPFTAGTFGAQWQWLNATSSSHAAAIVNYVRGEEGQFNTRSRLMDYDDDGTEEVIRVPDIISASPVVMGAPSSGYDNLYGDTSYQAFRQQYANRRNVVFTADNGGQIRAFNAGFPSEDGTEFELNPGGEVPHPLGSEIWAYVPLNILPHLQWLREPNYSHNYYVDGEPLLFDANVFTADADHPNGWGTLLLVGMGFGGSLVQLPAVSNRIFASAYVLLDVTNPEKPPRLLAEIWNPLMGYTTSRPALVKARRPGANNNWFSPSRNEWKLLIGSGPGGVNGFPSPDVYTNVTSRSSARFMLWDIAQLGSGGITLLDTSIPDAFVGSITSVDWNQDFIDDYAYTGTVESIFDSLGNVAEFHGRLLRVSVDGTLSESTLINPQQPFTASPITLVDDFNRRWVYGGTGRLLSLEDRTSTRSQNFYGVKEPVNSLGNQTNSAVNPGTLVDATNFEVFTDDGESLKNVVGSTVSDVVVGGATILNFDSLKVAMRSQPGWTIRLTHDGTLPSGRNLSEANSTASIVLFTEFNPPPHSCARDGSSLLYAVDFQTGTAPPSAPIGSSNTITHNSANVAQKKISLGAGLVQTPQLHKGGDGEVRAVTQTSSGTATSGSLSITYPEGGSAGWHEIQGQPAGIEVF